MAGGHIGALSRSSENDLKITFEKNGESVTLYIDAQRLDKAAFTDYISCALCCSQKSGFAACMARCLYDGQCCDGGLSNCNPV
jgi:hypothetical protein